MIELETFVERFRQLNKFQEPRRGPICSFPKPNRFRAKSRPELFLIQRRELPQGVNPPLMQNRQDLGGASRTGILQLRARRWGLSFLRLSSPWLGLHAPNLRAKGRYVQVNIN